MNPHPNPALEKRFLWSLALTGVILLAEVAGGLWTGSLALLSDAAHVFMDLFALGLSFIALRLSALPADDRHTYGYHRLEVLAALANGATLVVVALGIFGEAWERWRAPGPVKSGEMLVIAAMGLAVNLVVALVLGGHAHRDGEDDHGAHAEDVNLKSAWLHVVGDALSSLGVIAAAVVMGLTGWYWVDPLTSVLIGVIILLGSGRVLKNALHILVEGAPEHVSLRIVGEALTTAPGVVAVHDLHVWSLCAGHVALSAHVVLQDQPLTGSEAVMAELKARLRQRFGIEHTTIQFECAACGQGKPVIADVAPASPGSP